MFCIEPFVYKKRETAKQTKEKEPKVLETQTYFSVINATFVNHTLSIKG